MFHLNELITVCCNIFQFLFQRCSDPSSLLHNRSLLLYNQFTQGGEMADLDEALALQRSALELRPQGHPHRALSLGYIAVYLYARFNQLRRLSDLDEALAFQRSTLELCPPGNPDRAASLSNLANSLHARFNQLGRLSDLDEALGLQRSALELRPQGHSDRALSLGNTASYLYTRFNQLGRLSDLDEALVLERSVLELRPQGHPHRATSLGNIADCLDARFKQLGRLSDLDEAVALLRSTLELYPPGHPDRVTSLSDLANSLHTRFNQPGRLPDLDEALDLQRSTLELRPQGHPHRVISLGNIASYLYARFKQLGKLSDLDEALALQRSVLGLRPQGHLHRAASLGNIATCLHARFKQLGTLSDLDEALALEYSALELRPPGHPSRALSLAHLASSFHARFKHSATHDINDLQEAFTLYSQLSNVSQTVSSADLECAKQWIRAAEESKHSTTVLAYQTFLRFSVHHLATLPSLPQNIGLLKQLITSLAADAFSACLRDGNPTNAIELLEQGRGIFWSQLTRLRSPLDEVALSGDTGKELADKFTHLASSLRSVIQPDPNTDSQYDQASHLNIQLQDVIVDIRNLPGLSRFLQPLLFSDLQVAASNGPVIIVNASQYSCDALVLLSDRDPLHVALPITKADVSKLSLELRALIRRAKFEDATKEILVFLRKLWDEIISPIVNILQEVCPRRSRIWWCPTAEFSLLPLHAAASFRKGQPRLSDIYISSYTPTLTALIRARQQGSLDPSMEQQRFLIIGQAQAAGLKPLASVNAELSSIPRRAAIPN